MAAFNTFSVVSEFTLDLSDKDYSHQKIITTEPLNASRFIMHRCHLHNLPLQTDHFISLTDLDISFNPLEKLPPNICKLANLKYLTVTDAGIKKFPSDVVRSLKLDTLDLSRNAIGTIDTFSSKFFIKLAPKPPLLLSMKALRLAHNQFTSFPNAIFEFVNLQELDFSHNKLKALPSNLSDLQTLHKLNIEHCLFEQFPAEISACLKLNSLNVSGNKVVTIPKFTNTVPYVEELFFNKSEISDLSPIFPARLLRKLHANENKIKQIPMIETNQVEELVLVKNQLTEVPEYITKYKELVILNLASNNLIKIHPAICELNHLRELDLTSNFLDALPAELGSLKDIRKLFLNFNRLSSLPDMSQCAHLREIYAKGNKIATIAGALKNYPSLVLADLSDNQLTDASIAGVYECQYLEELDLSNNLLTDFTPQKDQLPELSILRLTNNEIDQLSNGVQNMTNIQEIYIQNNGKTVISEAVQEWIIQNNVFVDSDVEEPVQIAKNLWLGSIQCAMRAKNLKQYGITHIASPIVVKCHKSFVTHALNAKDIFSESALQFVKSCCFDESDQQCLVVCEDGKSTSVQFIIGCMIKYLQKTFKAAWDEIVVKQAQAKLTIEQQQQCEEWEKKCAQAAAATTTTTTTTSKNPADASTFVHILLDNEKNRNVFKEYCKIEKSLENVLFWEQVQQVYRKESAAEKRLQHAKQLFDHYISPDGETPLNIDSGCVEQIERELDELKLKAKTDATVGPTVSFFDAASQYVERNLMDTALRFKKNDLYLKIETK